VAISVACRESVLCDAFAGEPPGAPFQPSVSAPIAIAAAVRAALVDFDFIGVQEEQSPRPVQQCEVLSSDGKI
jgi:hypothetical protein